MLGLHSITSASAVVDFLTKKVDLGVTFKVWMLLVIAVAIALIVTLVVLLAVVKKNDKKLKTKKSEAVADENASIEDQTVEVTTVVDEKSPVDTVETEETVEEESHDDVTEEVNEQAVEENIEPEEPIAEETIVDETVAEETVEDGQSIENEEIAIDEQPVESEESDVVENVETEETVTTEESVADDRHDTEHENAGADVADNNTEDKIQEEANDNSMNTQEEQNVKTAVGRLNYYLTEIGYYFSLDANNGQQLFVSYSYTTLDGAKNGFETFANAVKDGKFIVSQDKNGRFKYILNKKYQGPNYKTRNACLSSIESVKKFAVSHKVNVIEEDPDVKAAFNNYLDEIKKSKSVDMEEMAKIEAETPKSGSFEIEEIEGEYRFYLYANNRQILYSSNFYASATSARNGIDTFKKAVYGGVVVIEKDKFDNYRYVLRNSNIVTYVGESFDNEASARNQFESVKRFVRSATIVPFKKKTDDEEE